VVRVEVVLEDAVEIWNLPSIPGLSWEESNVLAMQTVFDDLKRRAIEEGLSLGEMQMCARNPHWKPEME